MALLVCINRVVGNSDCSEIGRLWTHYKNVCDRMQEKGTSNVVKISSAISLSRKKITFEVDLSIPTLLVNMQVSHTQSDSIIYRKGVESSHNLFPDTLQPMEKGKAFSWYFVIQISNVKEFIFQKWLLYLLEAF